MERQRRSLIPTYHREEHLGKYVFDVVLYSVIIRCLISRVGYKCLYVHVLDITLSEGVTNIIYYVLLAAVLSIYILVIRGNKNFVYRILLGALPAGCMLMLKFRTYTWILVIMGVVYFLLCVIHEKCREQQNEKCRDLWRACRRLWAEWCAVMGGVVLFATLAYVSLLGISNVLSQEVSVKASVAYQEMLERDPEDLWEWNKEKLLLLNEDYYYDLELGEKMMALRTVLDIEMIYLGCEPTDLILMDLSGESYDGYYTYADREICLDKTMVETDIEATISALLHEAFHVYEYACCEAVDVSELDTRLKFFRDVAQWRKEFQDYKDGSDARLAGDFSLYKNQSVEEDARAYSAEWTKAYLRYIRQLGMEENNGE